LQFEKINTKYTNTNESTHSKMGPVRQNPIQRTNFKNCSCKCAYDCAQLQYTIQHRTDYLPSYLQTTIRCHLVSAFV